MRDIEFYAQVLGLVDPWFVDDVDLSIENRRVDIVVSHHEGRLWACPKCGVELPLHDHAETSRHPGSSRQRTPGPGPHWSGRESGPQGSFLLDLGL
jgi:hypothetical protein